MNTIDQIKKELNEIVDLTKQISFPLLSRNKEKIIYDEKEKIDRLIDSIVEKNHISISMTGLREGLWEDAQENAMKEFVSLPDKLRINSFYLQELLHLYADNQVQRIIEMIEQRDKKIK